MQDDFEAKMNRLTFGMIWTTDRCLRWSRSGGSLCIGSQCKKSQSKDYNFHLDPLYFRVRQ